MPARTLCADAGSFPPKRCLYRLDAPTIACRSKSHMHEAPMNNPTLIALWPPAAALATADCGDAGSKFRRSSVAPATSCGPGLTLHRSGLNGAWVHGKASGLDRFETNEGTARTGGGSIDSLSSSARRIPSNRRRARDDHDRPAADRLRGGGRHRRVARRGNKGDLHAPAAPRRVAACEPTDGRAVGASGCPRATWKKACY
jgi:hypothetical protein